MRGILISTLIGLQVKHILYMSVLLTGIIINTLIQAYMCVLMRHQNKGFS